MLTFNSSTQTPLHEMLSGENAFYTQEAPIADEFSGFPKVTDYSISLESRIYRFVKTLFKYTIGLPYTLMHNLLGYIILKASVVNSTTTRQNAAATLRNKGYEVKRITLDVDGYKVDAQIIGKKENLSNGKWTLFAGGNDKSYTKSVTSLLPFLEESENNLITFDYPSIGTSPGLFSSKEGCIKAALGLLELLEDQESGIQAKDITVWGYSFGAGVISEALARHIPKENVNYAVVKDRTFSSTLDQVHDVGTQFFEDSKLPSFIKSAIVNIVWFVAKFFGWNLDSAASTNTFIAPEYILQKSTHGTTARTSPLYTIKNAAELADTDESISKDSSLANRILREDFDGKRDNIELIGLSEHHLQPLNNVTQQALAKHIKPSPAFHAEKDYSIKEFEVPLKKVADYTVLNSKPSEEFSKGAWQSFFHKTVGYISSLPGQMVTYLKGDSKAKYARELRRRGFQVKRTRVDFNDLQIDAFKIGKQKNLDNGRWTIFCNGLGENSLAKISPYIMQFSDKTDSNLIIFNYAGYGGSTPLKPTQASYINSAKAILEMVQDDDKGLGAVEICLFGTSIGGGVIGSLLEEHSDMLKEDKKYVVVKDRTFSTIGKAAVGAITATPTRLGLPAIPYNSCQNIENLGEKAAWTLNATNSSKQLTDIPEVILQQAHTPEEFDKTQNERFTPYELKDVSELTAADGMISDQASMAYAILSDPSYPTENKTLLGISDHHFEPLSKTTITTVAEKVNDLFIAAA